MQSYDSQLLTVLLFLSIITLPLKAVALWKSARNEQKWWFIAVLLINTVGILELAYLFYYSKPTRKKKHED